MPAVTGRIRASSNYRVVLNTPGGWQFYLAAAPARIGLAMTNLGVVWLVHHTTGSYAAAGTVTGAFAVSEAVAGPQIARLIDRFGQTRTLPIILLLHGLAVALLIGLAVRSAGVPVLVGAGVLAGGSLPQIGALTSARWSHALRGSPVLPAAFALESLSTGLAFLVGPALIGTVSGLGDPVVGSALATGLVLAGGFALAAQRRTAPPPSTHHDRTDTARLFGPAFVALIGTNIGVGLFFGSMQVSVTAFAVERNAPGLAGPLYSITSLVCLFAGAAYGARRWRTAPSTQLLLALTALTVTSAPLLLATTPLTLAIALALPGLAIAPFQILSTLLAQTEVDSTVLTRAFTWLNSGSAAGIAFGAALSGHVLDTHTPHHGFTIALLSALLATTAALTLRRPLGRWRRRDGGAAFRSRRAGRGRSRPA